MITRRQFLGYAAASALVIPELVLPQTRFFLPPKGGWPKNYAEQAVNQRRYHYHWGVPTGVEVSAVPYCSDHPNAIQVQTIDGPGNGWKIIEGDTLVHEDWSDFSFPQKIRVST
jgi:hypothetical protein